MAEFVVVVGAYHSGAVTDENDDPINLPPATLLHRIYSTVCGSGTLCAWAGGGELNQFNNNYFWCVLWSMQAQGMLDIKKVHDAMQDDSNILLVITNNSRGDLSISAVSEFDYYARHRLLTVTSPVQFQPIPNATPVIIYTNKLVKASAEAAAAAIGGGCEAVLANTAASLNVKLGGEVWNGVRGKYGVRQKFNEGLGSLKGKGATGRVVGELTRIIAKQNEPYDRAKPAPSEARYESEAGRESKANSPLFFPSHFALGARFARS